MQILDQTEDGFSGLAVEVAGRLIGKQEVVIKSLGESLRNLSGVAGGAILGDGRVALILEMNALFNSGASHQGKMV